MSRRRNRSFTKSVVETGIPDERKSVQPTVRAGVAGTPVYGGFVQTNEKNADMIGDKKWKTFSDFLLNVSIVASGTRYFLNLISQPNWKAEPANDSAKAEEIAEFVTNEMSSMETAWNRVIRRAGLFRFYGFSLQEWTAVRRPDGRIGMLDIEIRPQSTITKWDTQENGSVLGVVQTAPTDGREIYLPRSKLIYVVDDVLSDSPEGVGLFRHLAEPCRVLRRYQQLEGWGFETDLRGIPVGRAPFGQMQQSVDSQLLKSQDRDAMVQPLRNFVENHIKNPKLGLMLDSMTYETQDESARPSGVRQWDLDLLKAGSTSQPDVARAIERGMRDCARVLAVEHLLLGETGVGSFAMAKDKSHNFYIIVDSTIKDLTQAFTKDWLRTLMELNGYPLELTPVLKCDKLQYRAIEQVTGALRDMAQAGALLHPNDPVITEVRDLLGLSKPIEVTGAALDAALLGPQSKKESPNGD